MIQHEDPDIVALGYRADKPCKDIHSFRVYYWKRIVEKAEDGPVAMLCINEYGPYPDKPNPSYEVEMYASGTDHSHSAKHLLYPYTKEEVIASIEKIEAYFLNILAATLDITKE